MQAVTLAVVALLVLLAIHWNAWYVRGPAIVVAVYLTANTAIEIYNVILRARILTAQAKGGRII